MKLYALVDYVQELVTSLVIYRLLRSHGIDVLHLNNGLSRIGLRAGRWASVPVVAHIRGHGGPRERVAPLQRRMAGSPAIVGAVAISNSVMESIIDIGMPREKARVIYNPVDVDAFDTAARRRDAIRTTLGFEPDAVVAGSFGRVMQYKGQEEFMLAAAPLLDRHPELRLMIVGDSSDAPDREYLEHLHDLARQAPFTDKVVFTGYRHHVANYFWACDVVVHSSQIREGFGRVVAEGMAARRAVIAMDEAGPQEIVTSGVDGLLVPPRDVVALSEALESLLDSAPLRESLGRAGRRTVAERFDVPVIAAQLEDFYRDLASIRHARST